MIPKSKSKWLLLPFIFLFFSSTIFSQVTIFEETFSSASGYTPPSGWENTYNSGTNSSDIWDFDNNFGRNITGGGFSGNFAILDSDGLGGGKTQNVTLTSIEFDASTYTNLILSFSNHFRFYSGQTGVIQVYNGSTWSTIVTYSSHTDYSTSGVR